MKVLSLTDRTASNAKAYADKLTAAGIRVEVDNRSETIGYKIRAAAFFTLFFTKNLIINLSNLLINIHNNTLQ
mgnify:CR=1 FL=1